MARLLLRGALLLLTLVSITVVGIKQSTFSSSHTSTIASYPTCLRPWEFDRQIRSQPDQSIDDRLLIIGITEEDIKGLAQWPFSDQTYADLLAEIQRHQPAVIGLALYKDLAIPPASVTLEKQLQRSNVILANHLRADYSAYEIPPRTGIPDRRTGFMNLVVDRDGVLRRHLLFIQDPGNKFFGSFSWQLAIHYLERLKIYPAPSPENAQVLQLGRTVLPPLRQNCSETATKLTGYQIPLYYRTREPIAHQVTLTQVLKKQVNPAWVKDKIVLIGVMSRTFQDFANTPYRNSKGDRGRHPMYGVELQAQMVSQLLTAALGN